MANPKLSDLEKPDIVSILENENIKIKKSGNRFIAPSPFREEKHPSFFIYPDTQRWYDFGMSRGGDVIDFVMLYKNLSFKDSLSYLGISTGKPTPEAIKKIEQEKYKRELVKAFKAWCNDYHNDLCRLYRALQKAKSEAKTIEEVEALAEFYHKESSWLYQIEILLSNDDEAKFNLYREVAYGI